MLLIKRLLTVLLLCFGPALYADAKNAPAEWALHGGDYREQRYSPLTQIDTGTVKNLGLAWNFDTDFNRGLEATPIVVDGVMYVTGNWSVVYALDGVTVDRARDKDSQISSAVNGLGEIYKMA